MKTHRALVVQAGNPKGIKGPNDLSGKTVAVQAGTSHELRFAHHVASSILMMDEGQVIQEAPPDRFFASPSHERTKRFLALVE